MIKAFLTGHENKQNHYNYKNEDSDRKPTKLPGESNELEMESVPKLQPC